MPLGQKYNWCAQWAQGPWIALWSDDDWHGPTKLADLMAALAAKPGALIAGARQMLFHRLGTGRTWRYEKPGDPTAAYFIGASVCFHKEYWRSVRRFDASARRAADAHFTNSLSRAEYAELAAVLPPHASLWGTIATIHRSNTGRPDADPGGPGWTAYDGDLRAVMGEAYDLWEPGGAICERIAGG